MLHFCAFAEIFRSRKAAALKSIDFWDSATSPLLTKSGYLTGFFWNPSLSVILASSCLKDLGLHPAATTLSVSKADTKSVSLLSSRSEAKVPVVWRRRKKHKQVHTAPVNL